MKTKHSAFRNCGFTSIFLLLVLASFLPACGWESDGLEILKDNLGIEDGDQEAEDEIEAIEMEVSGDTVSGVWLMKEELIGTATILVEGNLLEQTLYYLVTISEDATSMTADFCHYDGVPYTNDTCQEKTTGSNRTLPDTEEKISGWETELDGETTSIEPGKIVWLWGVKDSAENPETVALPTEENLDNMEDQDEDDNPGISLEVINQGTRYMARRQITTYAKAQLSTDGQWITGSLSFSSEDSPLGASVSHINRTAEVNPIEDASRYWLRRIGNLDDGQTYDCASLSEDTENQTYRSYKGYFIGAPEEERCSDN